MHGNNICVIKRLTERDKQMMKDERNLSQLLNANTYESAFETCPGCENHCHVRLFRFQNGNTFFAGNNCEKVYSNRAEGQRRGINMMAEKYALLFKPADIRPLISQEHPMRIGIPRALGMYENYPFWSALLKCCGFESVLSRPSTNRLYETGLRSVMADNICFPAKLMHGHINDLISRQVDRILYPYVVYEQKEDKRSNNSYNCPIVAGYSDVIRSAMDPEHRSRIPLDAPVITFSDPDLLRASCSAYLHTLGIDRATALKAVDIAWGVQENYLRSLTDRAMQVLTDARNEKRMVILLAARPYHIDPLVQHKIADAIAEMGIDVITENVAAQAGAEVYEQVNAVSQWAYPNRIFKAAWFCGKTDYEGLHMVELTSFGCGPDAFILDEVAAILNRFGKNLTILKIDDVNNIGSLRLRVRSMVESVRMAGTLAAADRSTDPTAAQGHAAHGSIAQDTKPFEESDRMRTLIAPYFAEGYSEFLTALFKSMGYRLICLPMGSQEDAEEGLRHANNDICYPATIIVGSIMRALKSGRYDLSRTAVIITQTGGQCRASNYYSLIKNAMIAGGFQEVPVVSLAIGSGVQARQPGFQVAWQKMLRIVIYAMIYADCLAKLYYATLPREKQKGEAARLRQKYTDLAQPLLEKHRAHDLLRLMEQAVSEFCMAADMDLQVPTVGVVGEIYVKYNSFSHKHVVNWLTEQGVEVVPPALCGYFTTTFVMQHVNRELHLKKQGLPLWITDMIYRYIRHVVRKYERICQPFRLFRPFSNIFDDARHARRVVNLAGDFGEGWGIPAEISHRAASGVDNVVSLQPFGCIANHVISKGIEKRLRQLYPHLNLLFLDFDSSTSEANIYNRLHFMLDNARRMQQP